MKEGFRSGEEKRHQGEKKEQGEEGEVNLPEGGGFSGCQRTFGEEEEGREEESRRCGEGEKAHRIPPGRRYSFKKGAM